MIFILLGSYEARIGGLLPAFRDGLVIPKRRYITTNLRRVKSQKSVDLIHVAAVSSNGGISRFICTYAAGGLAHHLRPQTKLLKSKQQNSDISKHFHKFLCMNRRLQLTRI